MAAIASLASRISTVEPLKVSSRRQRSSSSARRVVVVPPARAIILNNDDKEVSRREAVALPAAAVLAAVAATTATVGPAVAGAPPPLECAADLQTAASGLQFCEATVGTGREPTKGTTIKAHYTGRLLDGRVFDSSYTRGSPLQFKIGVGQVIR